MTAARILIVEDEIIIARELEARLTKLGYDVVGIASSGREAVELTEQEQPALVLMDIVLKGDMDGIEAAGEIRKRCAVPVIYLTAYTDETTLRRAKVTEPYGYIVKPFSERELIANIEMSLYKHRAETKLRTMEKWFSASMQHVADGVIATSDRDGTVSYINRIAEAVAGWRSEEVVGKKVAEVFRFIAKNGHAKAEYPVVRTLDEGIVSEMARNVVLVNRSGEEIPVDYTGACVRDAEGDPTGVVLVFRDLRDQKQTEDKLRKLEAQLLQAQKMEAIGQLAGGVAHDFNNMLTVISSYGEILLTEGRLEPQDQDLVREIKRAGERAAALTRQLLIFSRKQVLESKVFDLNALVADTETMLRSLIGEDILLTTDLAPGLGKVKADPGQIEQVIMNLAVNARDAMPQGGKLTIETANVELDETYAEGHLKVKPGRYVMLAISDTGCGMTEEVKAHLFEPFFTTKAAGKGTGLGLATVYGIVKQSDGHVGVYSEEGLGTTIKVYLSPVEEDVAVEEPHSRQETAPVGTETLLLTEDDATVRALAHRILQRQGYTVLQASSAKEAIRLVEDFEGEIHLLVTDVVMPEMGGRQLAERLVITRPGLKVLYVSGYTDDAVIRHGVLQADVAFLQKPYTPVGLASKVRAVLDEPN
jgi:two-component system, cell cycle sensor histidine kinase and response regulator CckA